MPAARDYRDLSHRLSSWPGIAAYEEAHPEMDGDAIGRALTGGATRAELLAWAIRHVSLAVDSLRRQRAREAEDRAAARHEAELIGR